MESEVEPTGPQDEARVLLEMSGLRDRIERLDRMMRGTVGAGGAITLLFLVGATFMERGGARFLLAGLWVLFTLRLLVINRRSAREKGLVEFALQALEATRQASALPVETSEEG